MAKFYKTVTSSDEIGVYSRDEFINEFGSLWEPFFWYLEWIQTHDKEQFTEDEFVDCYLQDLIEAAEEEFGFEVVEDDSI